MNSDELAMEIIGNYPGRVRLSNKKGWGNYWWCYMDDICAQGSDPISAIVAVWIKTDEYKNITARGDLPQHLQALINSIQTA